MNLLCSNNYTELNNLHSPNSSFHSLSTSLRIQLVMDPIDTYQNPLYIFLPCFLLCLSHYTIIHYTKILISIWCNWCFGKAGKASRPMLLSEDTWKGEGMKMKVLECVICLRAIDEGEKVRILPKCKHTFHIECVDQWLGLCSMCPLCRAALTPVFSISLWWYTFQ
jgi:Ring finger domain